MVKPFVTYLEIFIKRRFFVVRFVLTVTIIATIISLLLIQKFTATATILPPNPTQEAMIGLISANVPSGLTGLGRLSGLMPGATTPSDLFADLMKSDRIKNMVINKFNLMHEFRVKTITDARRFLDDITEIEVSGQGIISVSVTYKNKQLAADIANSLVEELDKFNTETAMTTGKRYRIFIEERLKDTGDTLASAEVALRNFQNKNRTIALDAEIESAIKTIAELKSRVILQEVQKGAVMSFSNVNNPYVQNIDNELRELKKQLAEIEIGGEGINKSEFGAGFSIPFSKLPAVSLEYARLLRDVKIQEAIFEVLTQQYEQAKIMELKDTPTVQFLDRAVPPEKKSYPRRGAIIVFSAVTALLVGIFLAYFLEYLTQLKKIPEWQDNYGILKRDVINFKKRIWKLLKR